MHFCTAKIAIAGDERNVYTATEFDPVSWPEIQVLQFLHGPESITDVEVFASAAQAPRDERQRLLEKYREAPIIEVFGGRQAPAEMEAPDVTIHPGIRWMNPITRKVETTGNGHSKEVDAIPREGGRFAAKK